MSILSKIPIVGSVFGAAGDVLEAVVNIVKLLASFFSEIDELFKIFINFFSLIKEIIMGGIVFVKNIIDIFIESIRLIEYVNDLIAFALELLSRYMSVPIAFLILIPFFIASNYMISIIDKAVSAI